MTAGAPPRASVDKHREALELARRRTALQVDTVAHAVTGLDDTVGWSRLTELGTASTVRAQSGAVTATTELLSATLDAAGVAADLADALPGIEPGRLASGRDVRGMFDRTRDIVQARMAGGAAFPEALDASANVLTAIASSEPHRIARDGQFNVGLSDDRFDKFRRVTVGTSCAFCAMLATRGAVYLTAESAGQSRRYHYKCDCYVELVVDPAAIESSKSTSEDWRKAIRDQERLRAADVRREFADLTDDDLARLAGNRPDSALSADLLAERARRAAPPVSAKSPPVKALPPGWAQENADDLNLYRASDGVTSISARASDFGGDLGAASSAVADVAADVAALQSANPTGGLVVEIVDMGSLNSAGRVNERVMTLNSRLFTDPEANATWAERVADGYFLGGPEWSAARTVTTHEYGHRVSLVSADASGAPDADAYLAFVIRKEVESEDMFDGLSDYAKGSAAGETYAELFVAHIAGLADSVPASVGLAKREGWGRLL